MRNRNEHIGGPSQSPKDEPTADRDNRNATSRQELTDRTHRRGELRGADGRRNGSDKHR
ncbi:MAG: hypothetical protein JWO97_1937 [Acidobacteria bacterium]|jgi:hypothetical protein|nr:hypothetical protein [Acidobacteriota bacterium]